MRLFLGVKRSLNFLKIEEHSCKIYSTFISGKMKRERDFIKRRWQYSFLLFTSTKEFLKDVWLQVRKTIKSITSIVLTCTSLWMRPHFRTVLLFWFMRSGNRWHTSPQMTYGNLYYIKKVEVSQYSPVCYRQRIQYSTFGSLFFKRIF